MLAWLLLNLTYLECIQQILVDSADQSGLTVWEKKNAKSLKRFAMKGNFAKPSGKCVKNEKKRYCTCEGDMAEEAAILKTGEAFDCRVALRAVGSEWYCWSSLLFILGSIHQFSFSKVQK